MFFILFSIEFVANHALLVALNLSRITHFWCKFLCPKKAAGVNVLPYSNSEREESLVIKRNVVQNVHRMSENNISVCQYVNMSECNFTA